MDFHFQTFFFRWPPKFETDLNADNPLEFSPHASLYLSSSPPPFCPHGREVDIDAITKIIDGAEKFVYIAVMDYSPSFLYDDAHQFWPVIDNHIRKGRVCNTIIVFLFHIVLMLFEG